MLCDIVTRTIRHPWLWLQEATSIFFVYGSFIGMAVATRRADHLYLSAITDSLSGMKRTLAETFNRLVVLACGLLMVTFGYTNFLHGFGSFRMPSLTPSGLVVSLRPRFRDFHLLVRRRTTRERLAERF